MNDTPKKPQNMMDRNFGVASFKFNRWSAELDETQSLDDCMRPEFWSGQAEKIMGHDKTKPRGRGDIIEVRQLSTGLYAEFLVTEVGAGYIRVAIKQVIEPKSGEVAKDSPLVTQWNVGKRMHEVVRKSDKSVMAGNFQTKDAAIKWIADHMQAMAA